MTNKDLSKRTLELKTYILRDYVEEYSDEFLPFAAAVQVLETTPQTLKHRIESGELEEKSFFFANETSKKMYRGVEIGGVKRLLVKKAKQKALLIEHINKCLIDTVITTYADAMEYAGMSWRLAPETKYCNSILESLNIDSYQKTVDSGRPCMISSIVVSRNERIPTDSYFSCAIELGLLEMDSSKDERVEFWRIQKKLAFELFGSGYEQ